MSRTWKEITLDSNSDVWDRQEPIEGKLVKTEHDIGPNKSKMYVFEQDDKEVKVWGSTVLDDKLLGVPAGTYVKLEYEGKLKSKKGAEYHSYKVYIDEDSVPDETPTDLPEDSGYQAARAQAHSLKDGKPVPLDDDEPPLTDDDEPVDLSGIPF